MSRGYGDRKKKGEIKFNPATDRAYGGSQGFQAGSTFKVFVAAAALEDGYPFSYPIFSPYKKEIGDIKWCGGTLTDPWDPANESQSENGTYTLQTGLESSVNTYFAQLEERTGVCRPAQIARQLGVTTASGKPLEQIKSFTLGTNLVSPMTMAEAYATFAARGKHCNSVAILEVTDPGGNRLPVPAANCQQVLDQSIADGMNELLQGVIQRGTGTRAALSRPAAGKTGTTDRRYNVWFVGYTPELSTAVWAGNPSPPKNGYPLSNIYIGGVYYGDVCGGCLPGPIWQQMMSNTLEGTPVSDFTSAGDTVRQGNAQGLPSVSGMSLSQAKDTLRALNVEPVVSSRRVYVTYAPAGTVAYSYPGTGAPAYPGQRVLIYISAGPPAAPAPVPPPTTQPQPGNGNSGNGNGNGQGNGNGNGAANP